LASSGFIHAKLFEVMFGKRKGGRKKKRKKLVRSGKRRGVLLGRVFICRGEI